MRITGGRYRGRRLRCPKQDLRPVTAKMREAIFSMLYSRYGSLAGLCFLDMFCGSAVMSLEAASRGVSYIEAVERDRRKKKILQENLGMLDVPWRLHIADAHSYLARIAAQAFDIIYLDPPFRMEGKAELLRAMGPSLLRPGSLVMLQLPRTEEKFLPATLDNSLRLESCKYYGGSVLGLYQAGI